MISLLLFIWSISFTPWRFCLRLNKKLKNTTARSGYYWRSMWRKRNPSTDSVLRNARSCCVTSPRPNSSIFVFADWWAWLPIPMIRGWYGKNSAISMIYLSNWKRRSVKIMSISRRYPWGWAMITRSLSKKEAPWYGWVPVSLANGNIKVIIKSKYRQHDWH